MKGRRWEGGKVRRWDDETQTFTIREEHCPSTVSGKNASRFFTFDTTEFPVLFPFFFPLASSLVCFSLSKKSAGLNFSAKFDAESSYYINPSSPTFGLFSSHMFPQVDILIQNDFRLFLALIIIIIYTAQPFFHFSVSAEISQPYVGMNLI